MDSLFSVDMNLDEEIKERDLISTHPSCHGGCPFANRCEACMEICKKKKPKLTKVGHEHEIACHLFEM